MRNYKMYTQESILKEAELILEPQASTHTVASALRMGQSTVWYHLTHQLKEIDPDKFQEVQLVLKSNNTGGGR